MLQHWQSRGLPLSASAFRQNQLWVRLSGQQNMITSAAAHMGGERMGEGSEPWIRIREKGGSLLLKADVHKAEGQDTVFRIRMATPCPAPESWKHTYWERSGALHWLKAATEETRKLLTWGHDHHALVQICRRNMVMTPWSSNPVLRTLNERLKKVFDPMGIFNLPLWDYERKLSEPLQT